jgi:hypothetical protein
MRGHLRPQLRISLIWQVALKMAGLGSGPSGEMAYGVAAVYVQLLLTICSIDCINNQTTPQLSLNVPKRHILECDVGQDIKRLRGSKKHLATSELFNLTPKSIIKSLPCNTIEVPIWKV